MSIRYLLECSCGESLPVSAAQAGGEVACAACGSSLRVPRLRDLQNLPTEAEDAPSAKGWSFRLGVLSAGILLAAVLGAGAGYFASTEPEPPTKFDASARATIIESGLKAKTPLELWELYASYYEPMAKHGFFQAESPQDIRRQQEIDRSRLYRNTLLYAAGGVLAAAVGGFALLPK